MDLLKDNLKKLYLRFFDSVARKCHGNVDLHADGCNRGQKGSRAGCTGSTEHHDTAFMHPDVNRYPVWCRRFGSVKRMQGAYVKIGLNQISIGDEVMITDKKGLKHIYEVTETGVVNPYDNSIKTQSDEKELTLFYLFPERNHAFCGQVHL